MVAGPSSSMTAWQAQAKNSFFEEEKWAGLCLWNPTPRVTASGAGRGAVTPWEAMGARARGAPRPRGRGRPQRSGSRAWDACAWAASGPVQQSIPFFCIKIRSHVSNCQGTWKSKPKACRARAPATARGCVSFRPFAFVLKTWVVGIFPANLSLLIPVKRVPVMFLALVCSPHG